MPRDTLQYVIYPENQKQLDTLKEIAEKAGFKNLSQYLIFVGLNAKIKVTAKEEPK